MLSGCASSVLNDVNLYEREISSSEKNISTLESKIARVENDIRNYKSIISRSRDIIRNNTQRIKNARSEVSKSEAYLSSNPEVYINGQCVKPSLGPKPKPYCESRSEAKEHALAYCSMPVGCDAAMLVASDELDTFSKRFLASEACSRAVQELRNEGYSPDSTVVNALEALSDTGCSNESTGFWSFIGKVSGCLMSASIKLAKIQSYVNCIEQKTEACYSNYKSWLSSPEKRKRECIDNVRKIDTNIARIAAYKRQIADSKQSIQENERNIKNSLSILAEARKQLEQEKERKARYSRLLSERKKTLAYKIYGK